MENGRKNAAHSPEQELQSEIVPECGFILLFRTFGNLADFFDFSRVSLKSQGTLLGILGKVGKGT